MQKYRIKTRMKTHINKTLQHIYDNNDGTHGIPEVGKETCDDDLSLIGTHTRNDIHEQQFKIKIQQKEEETNRTTLTRTNITQEDEELTG